MSDMSSDKAVLARLWRESLAVYWPQFLMILALVAVIAAATSLYPVLIKIAFDAFSGQLSLTAGPDRACSARRVIFSLVFLVQAHR